MYSYDDDKCISKCEFGPIDFVNKLKKLKLKIIKNNDG